MRKSHLLSMAAALSLVAVTIGHADTAQAQVRASEPAAYESEMGGAAVLVLLAAFAAAGLLASLAGGGDDSDDPAPPPPVSP